VLSNILLKDTKENLNFLINFRYSFEIILQPTHAPINMKDYNPKNQLKPLWRTPQQRKAVKNKETIAEEPCCPDRPFCGNVVVYNPIGSYECHRVKVNERKNIEYVHGFLCFIVV